MHSHTTKLGNLCIIFHKEILSPLPGPKSRSAFYFAYIIICLMAFSFTIIYIRYPQPAALGPHAALNDAQCGPQNKMRIMLLSSRFHVARNCNTGFLLCFKYAPVQSTLQISNSSGGVSPEKIPGIYQMEIIDLQANDALKTTFKENSLL